MKHLIYLMRHAHIETNSCMVGQSDLALSSLGVEQAIHWRKEFEEIHFDTIYTSPLKRTIQTAELIVNNTNRHIKVIEDFCEISLGLWEGQKKEEIKQQFPQEWKKRGEDFYFTPAPKGESFYDVEKRALPAFYKICKEIQTNKANALGDKKQEISYSLIVAHQLVNRLILAELLGIEKNKIIEIPQSYACVSLISVDKKSVFLERKNCPF